MLAEANPSMSFTQIISEQMKQAEIESRKLVTD